MKVPPHEKFGQAISKSNQTTLLKDRIFILYSVLWRIKEEFKGDSTELKVSLYAYLSCPKSD